MSIKWSFSALKSFLTCPRQYQYKYVLKALPDTPKTEAIIYGEEFHSAAELYIRDNKPLPPRFEYAKSILDMLNDIQGAKHCEYKMGLTSDLNPCEFFDKSVWFRGVADLIVISEDGKKAHIVDYKTGANAKYADMGQLELMALSAFKHFPTLEKVKAGLLFVIANAFPKATFDREQESSMWEKWLTKHRQLEQAYKSDVWNPNPSGLCRKHCDVMSCPHNGRS